MSDSRWEQVKLFLELFLMCISGESYAAVEIITDHHNKSFICHVLKSDTETEV